MIEINHKKKKKSKKLLKCANKMIGDLESHFGHYSGAISQRFRVISA